MDCNSSFRAQVATSLLPRLNSNFCFPLIERCGGIEGFFCEREAILEAIYKEFNLSSGLFDREAALRGADHEIELINKHRICICSMEDENYPELLRQCEDAPIVFFYRGNIDVAAGTKMLAVVGTRNASARCQHKVDSVLSDLSLQDGAPIIVSGLAYGIDASAHRASLKYRLRTFAVLAHGLHMVYPATHKQMAQSILESNGALISELPCSVSTHPGHFLKRNRIIAGLSHATLVAESAEKGGAMSTAHQALGYNRDVMAFPGRSEDKYSAGCNRLIKDNVAALVDHADDVARILGLPRRKVVAEQTTLNFFEADEREVVLRKIMTEKGECHIDELGAISGIPQGALSALLLQMELEGKVLALPGKHFVIKG